MQNTLKFLPLDLMQCSSQDMFGSDMSKEFMDKHVRVRSHIVETFRDRESCSCNFCSMSSKRNVRVKGHMLCLAKINEDEHLKFSKPLPIRSTMIETDCSRMAETK